MWRYLKYSYKVIVYVHSPYEHARSQCLSMAYAFSIPALSRSKCRYLQSLLQYAKANALRLNELSHAELMYIAALTPTQLVIFKWAIQADRPACMYNCKMIVNKNTQGINALGVCFQVNSCIRGTSQKDWRHSLVSFCQCYL